MLLLVGASGAEDPANRYPFAKGTIDRLDPAGKQIALRTAAGVRTFEVNDRTYMFLGTEKLTFAKLKLGYPVKLSYITNETGQAIVRRLKVDFPEPPPPAPPAKP
jgi:hypothetical protein